MGDRCALNPVRRVFLQVALLLLAADALLGSMLVLGGRSSIARFIPEQARPQVTDLFVLHKIETAALRFGLGIMLLLAAREPERNTAVVIGISASLFAVAVAELTAPHFLGINSFYPAYLTWLHAGTRVLFAGALIGLWASPRGRT